MLTALDIAGRELGFVHGDMRIANIMEHRPRDDAQACVIRSNRDPDSVRLIHWVQRIPMTPVAYGRCVHVDLTNWAICEFQIADVKFKQEIRRLHQSATVSQFRRSCPTP